MKFYNSIGFESEHGIWVRRVDAAYAIDEAQMVAVTLSLKLGTAETRIEELEAENKRLREELAMEIVYGSDKEPPHCPTCKCLS